MKCPECGSEDTKVTDSRSCNDGSVRRRRECNDCNFRFTTYERVSEKAITVVKNGGSVELYDRNKLLNGIMRACVKRKVSMSKIESIVDDIEFAIRNDYKGQIKSRQLGDLVLEQLASTDDVAYIRFASVYKDFQSADEFKLALDKINPNIKI